MAVAAPAGTYGRLRLAMPTPVLTSPLPTYGTPTTTVLASITGWDINESDDGQAPRVMTFESTANANGVLAGNIVQGGGVTYSVDIKGVFSLSESPALKGKPFVVVDLIVFKGATGTQKGYPNVKGRLGNFKVGTAVDAKTATFSAQLEVDEHLPDYSSTI